MSEDLGLRKLSYVTLWTVKFEEVLQFYRDVLELPVAEESPGFVIFNTEGARLAFHKLESGEEQPLARRTVEIHLEVEDVDRAYEALKAKGVPFEHGPVNRPWGLRQAALRDPEGYGVELVGPLKEGEPIIHEGEGPPG